MVPKLLTSAIAFAVCGTLALRGQQAGPPAVYTSAQAEDARAAFQIKLCADCHTPALTGRKGDPDEAPPLSSLPAGLQQTIRGAGGKVPPLAGADCHNDAHVNGGLTLEHFDAADADPSLVAMLVSKVRTGAIGAAGVPVPDKLTQDSLLSALLAETAGADQWTVNSAQNPAMLTATIMRQIVPGPNAPQYRGAPDVYRLTVTCRADTQEGEMLLAWAPASPTRDNVMSVVVDGKAPIPYQVEGSEKMFKGAVGTMGTGATILNARIESSGTSKVLMPLPEQTLTISHLSPGETVKFSFGDLPRAAREALSNCIADQTARQ